MALSHQNAVNEYLVQSKTLSTNVWFGSKELEGVKAENQTLQTKIKTLEAKNRCDDQQKKRLTLHLYYFLKAAQKIGSTEEILSVIRDEKNWFKQTYVSHEKQQLKSRENLSVMPVFYIQRDFEEEINKLQQFMQKPQFDQDDDPGNNLHSSLIVLSMLETINEEKWLDFRRCDSILNK